MTDINLSIQVEFLSSLNLFATRFILPIHVLDMPEELLKKCQYCTYSMNTCMKFKLFFVKSTCHLSALSAKNR